MLCFTRNYSISAQSLLWKVILHSILWRTFTNAYSTKLVAKPATVTPCCMDMLTPGVCRGLLHRDPEKFFNNCRQDPDFSFMQCCFTCHYSEESYVGFAPSGADLYMHDASNLLLNPHGERNYCIDRHGSQFCSSFLERRGRWAPKQVSCEHASLAFRICRKTCGYCTSFLSRATVKYDGQKARSMKECQRLF